MTAVIQEQETKLVKINWQGIDFTLPAGQKIETKRYLQEYGNELLTRYRGGFLVNWQQYLKKANDQTYYIRLLYLIGILSYRPENNDMVIDKFGDNCSPCAPSGHLYFTDSLNAALYVRANKIPGGQILRIGKVKPTLEKEIAKIIAEGLI